MRMTEIVGRRARPLPAPPPVVWADLRHPRTDGPRFWLRLADDEQPPTVIRAFEPREVVWSSLWPNRPDDRIVLECLPHGCATRLRFTHESPTMPDPGATGHYRKRLNELLYRDLRASYSQ